MIVSMYLLEHFNLLNTQLSNFGVKLEDKMTLLLAWLPTSFDYLVNMLMFEKETLEI